MLSLKSRYFDPTSMPLGTVHFGQLLEGGQLRESPLYMK